MLGAEPSLSLEQLNKLLKIIEPFTYNVKEYSFETNPETLDVCKLKMLKKYGVNRISIGVESTNDKILSLIGRKHNFFDVIKICNILQEIGITNYNFDLILGLPHSSKKLLKEDLKKLISLNPKHISAYSLTVNPHTVFFNKKIKELDCNEYFELYKIVNDELIKNGFFHYEVSNWAKKGYESKHNLTYWRNENYYGFGLGAASYLDSIRVKNTVSINNYINNKDISELKDEVEFLTKRDEIFYQVMLNLRTSEGLNLKKFEKKFNFDFLAYYGDIVKELMAQNYLKITKNNLIPTFKGMLNLDFVTLKIFEKD